MGSFTQGLAQMIANGFEEQETTIQEQPEESRNELYESVKASESDIDKRIQCYVDARLNNVSSDGINNFHQQWKENNAKNDKLDLNELKECFDSLTPKERLSYFRFYKRNKQDLSDKDRAVFDSVLEGYSPNADIRGTDTDETTDKIESALKENGFDVKVSRHKIKYTTPCILVEFESNITKDMDLEPIKEIMGGFGYKYQSRRRNSLYFVE